jgi:hypothetical protein
MCVRERRAGAAICEAQGPPHEAPAAFERTGTLSLLALLVQKLAVSSKERHELLPKQPVLSLLAFLVEKVQILTPEGRGCSGRRRRLRRRQTCSSWSLRIKSSSTGDAVRSLLALLAVLTCFTCFTEVFLVALESHAQLNGRCGA